MALKWHLLCVDRSVSVTLLSWNRYRYAGRSVRSAEGKRARCSLRWTATPTARPSGDAQACCQDGQGASTSPQPTPHRDGHRAAESDDAREPAAGQRIRDAGPLQRHFDDSMI